MTGDITDDDGTPAAYAAARHRLDRLQPPWRVLPGNHDERTAFRAAFRPAHGYLQGTGFLHHAHDLGPLRLVCLDTLLEGGGGPHGELGPARLAWLEGVLAAAPARPTLLVMHHPPHRTGLVHLDGSRLRDGPDLARLLGRHAQVQALLTGHLHRPSFALWHGRQVITAPSTGFQFPAVLDRAVKGGIVLEPPGFLLHRWSAADGLVTLPVASAPPGRVHPF